ncbi:MAG TPA: hypothetical protein VFN10_24090 [Thermoanaerobaculia bacterium]|nr:hypothetical protein [Thermoanaerobaculia bacterium]
MTPRRTLIGRASTLATRERIYELPDGLEIDANEQYEVSRKRVFYTDVQLVTIHREKGVAFPLINYAFSAIWFLFAAIAFANGGDVILPSVFLAIGMPTFILGTLRVIYGMDVVTVFGRRSKATVKFWFRKSAARALYGRLCAQVRQAQRELEQQYASEETAAATAEAPEYELPPSAT